MLELAADSGLAVLTYTAEAGSKSAEALDLLASWTATTGAADAAESAERAS
jgi:hypothetical protein